MLVLNITLPVGTPVTYKILGFTPPDALQGALTNSSTVSSNSGGQSTILFYTGEISFDTFPLTDWIVSDQMFSTIPFTFRVILPDCYKDFSNPFIFWGS
jgi:hypothetical protein